MSIFSSYKKIFLLGFIIVILIAIPFSVYIAQQRQRTTTQAAKSTVLSFEPAGPTVKVSETLTFNVVLDPGTGSTANQVSFVKLSISFDPEKFTTVADSLKPNPASPNTLTSVLEDAVYTSGKATISLSIGADPTKVVTTKTKIAILQLKALSATNADNPKTSVVFDSVPSTQVLSIASSDQTSENVLSTTTPATVTINPASTSTSTSTSSPTPTVTAAPANAASTPTPMSVNFPSSPLSQGETTSLSTGSAVFFPAPVFETEPTPIVLLPQEPLPPTGPGENILGIGILGVIFTIIGGALFLLL
jgi:hypothetical protein